MKLFEKAIVHVGTNKTGSTALQRSLDAMRGALVRRGELAYLPGVFHPLIGSACHPRPETFDFNRNHNAIDPNVIAERDRRYLAEVGDFLTSAAFCRMMMVSYEHLFPLPVDALKGIVHWTREYAESALALVYVRHPYSYAISAMSQRAQGGLEPMPEGRVPKAVLRRTLPRLIEAFGPESVMVRAYDPSLLRDGDILVDCLHAIGASDIIGTADYVGGSRINTRMSAEALTFITALRDEVAHVEGVPAGSRYLRNCVKPFFSTPGRSIRLTPSQAAEIASSSRMDLEYLRSEFGIEFSQTLDEFIDPTDRHAENALLTSLATVVAQMIGSRGLPAVVAGHVDGVPPSMQADAGSVCTLDVLVWNDSPIDWNSADRYPLNVACRFRDRAGGIAAERSKSPLPGGRLAGHGYAPVRLNVLFPRATGHYTLEVSVIQERHVWFDEIGFTAASSAVVVV